jgi:hypothetical protein
LKYDLNLKEYDVSFDKVTRKINDQEMKQKLLECKKETVYLDDFCNYNKHRNIVKVKQVWHFVSMYQPSFAYDVDEFKRNGREYPPQILEYQLHYQYNLVINMLKNITGYRFPLRNPDC